MEVNLWSSKIGMIVALAAVGFTGGAWLLKYTREVRGDSTPPALPDLGQSGKGDGLHQQSSQSLEDPWSIISRDLGELELQYSPSRWSNRFSDPSEVISHHCRVVTAASERVKSKVPYETEISYGQRQGQKLDVFGGTRLPNSSPIFVFLHGGYWQELSKNISSYCVAPLFDAGIRVVIVGYDLAPKVKLETIVEEIEEAAAYIMKYAIKLGSRRVVFGGHSAGAHLLAMLLSSVWYRKLHDDQRKLINGFILFSGVFNLKPIINTYINDALSLSQSDARLFSPMFLDIKQSDCKKLPKILVVVGQYDSPAFQEQSKQYVQKLQHENYEVRLLTIPDVDHFDIVANLDSDQYILVKTMIEFIKS